MRGDFSLIVEGDEDVRFLQDFIEYHFKERIQEGFFIKIGGKSETIHVSRTKIQSSSRKGNRNILVFDADDSDFESTMEQIEKNSIALDIDFDSIFLFPDNRGKGNLESLLKSCVTDGNEKLFDCIESYESCRAAVNLKSPRPIDEKEKIRIYYGSFLDVKRVKGSERVYLNPDIWNLDSPSLTALKDFLQKELF